MSETISWIATAATVTAATMTASNLGSRITGYGFAVFTIGSIAWLTHGLMSDQPALVWTNIVLTGLNLFGVWRWLGRQARVEDGARSAAHASEHRPGESLFPISLLAHAKVVDRAGHEIGTTVDAMAGCTGGRLAYVVVSEGGVAGVGETLRRLPWADVHVEEERLVCGIAQPDFCRLEALDRDDWPSR